MNAPNTWTNEEDADYGTTIVYARREQNRETQMRRHSYERRARPSSTNGIHRRRNKRFAW
jgi:hypothetical protein